MVADWYVLSVGIDGMKSFKSLAVWAFPCDELGKELGFVDSFAPLWYFDDNGTQLECLECMWKYLRDEIDRRGDE